MTKLIVFLLVSILIIGTSIIKKSTKEIDDEIYSLKENLLILENRFQDSKLENNYLSSSEKLIEFQKLYFENSLKKKNLKDLKLLKIIDGEIVIQQLEFLEKNGE